MGAVGEESEAGEDETMRCQPVPTRSPAAALMSPRHAQPRGPRRTERVPATLGGREWWCQERGAELKMRGCPVLRQARCPPSGCSSSPGASLKG